MADIGSGGGACSPTNSNAPDSNALDTGNPDSPNPDSTAVEHSVYVPLN